MPSRRRFARLLGRAAAAAAVVSGASLLAGCGHGTKAAAAGAPLATAPEPAVSPPAQANLPGTLYPLAGSPEGVVVDRSGLVAVSVRNPGGIVLFPIGQPDSRRTVPIGGEARHLALATPAGPLLVPDEPTDQLVEVDLPTGQLEVAVGVGRNPHNAAGGAGGTVFVADELANTISIVNNSVVTKVVRAPLQPGGVTASADGTVMVAVGVRGRQVTAYHLDGTVIGSAACGAGPTHEITGNGGLYWVADTNGGNVLGFRVSAHGITQVATIPVGPKPYGLAFDPKTDTLWVTLTGADRLVGLHLRGSSVSSRTVLDTVQQPNTVAVDPASGTLVVTGSTPSGYLQIIHR